MLTLQIWQQLVPPRPPPVGKTLFHYFNPGLITSDTEYLVPFDIQGYSRPGIAVSSQYTSDCGNSCIAECASSHEKSVSRDLRSKIWNEVKQACRVLLSDD
jgi:hypothetical protein